MFDQDADPVVTVSVVPEGYLIHIENSQWNTRMIVGPKTFDRLCAAGLQIARPGRTGSIPLRLVEWGEPDLPKKNTA